MIMFVAISKVQCKSIEHLTQIYVRFYEASRFVMFYVHRREYGVVPCNELRLELKALFLRSCRTKFNFVIHVLQYYFIHH